MKILSIAAVNLRRLLRDRTNLFFVFVLPLVIVFVLGAIGSGSEGRIGLVVEGAALGPGRPLAATLAEQIESVDGASVLRFDSVDEALTQLRRDEIEGLVVIPADHDEVLRAGGVSTLRYASSPEEGFALRALLDDVVIRQSTQVRAALVAAERGLGDFDEAIEAAIGREPRTLNATVVGVDGSPLSGADRPLDQVAGQQLVLFTFLTGLVGGVALIESRRYGAIRRMLATPTSAGEIVVGEAGGRYLITIVQAMFIAVATAVLFGVQWGSWTASLAIMVLFSVTASGAALLLGVLLRNESQASGMALALGITLGAFGGSMFPLELFPDGVRIAAHLTPHAWANDAFDTVVRGGGGLTDITTELAVLAAYGSGLVVLATLLFRRQLSRATLGQ